MAELRQYLGLNEYENKVKLLRLMFGDRIVAHPFSVACPVCGAGRSDSYDPCEHLFRMEFKLPDPGLSEQEIVTDFQKRIGPTMFTALELGCTIRTAEDGTRIFTPLDDLEPGTTTAKMTIIFQKTCTDALARIIRERIEAVYKEAQRKPCSRSASLF